VKGGAGAWGGHGRVSLEESAAHTKKRVGCGCYEFLEQG
jgi:hypothetical protein